MAINNFITQKAKCARVFTFELIDGKEADYQQYLVNVVEVIDHDAYQKGTFLEVLTLSNDAPEKQRIFQRVFLFESEKQRANFASKMAESAIIFDGSENAQLQRKEYANTLRVQLAVNDYTFC
ncbi:hypothetical protein [Orbus mooreae]|uniref:hypothetical protein n=1 Tax=Orbus mooreae TaxID=3074107 RepID=UPI00370D35ED